MKTVFWMEKIGRAGLSLNLRQPFSREPIKSHPRILQLSIETWRVARVQHGVAGSQWIGQCWCGRHSFSCGNFTSTSKQCHSPANACMGKVAAAESRCRADALCGIARLDCCAAIGTDG